MLYLVLNELCYYLNVLQFSISYSNFWGEDDPGYFSYKLSLLSLNSSDLVHTLILKIQLGNLIEIRN